MAPVKFGGPGYESAVASGVVLPYGGRHRDGHRACRPEPTLAPLAVRRTRDRSPAAGFAAVALLDGPCSTACARGCAISGEAPSSSCSRQASAPPSAASGALSSPSDAAGARADASRCVLLALAGPLGGIAISVARFYGSPMIFAYDPFFGYFSGALYDTVVDVRSRALVVPRGGPWRTATSAPPWWPPPSCARRKAGSPRAGPCASSPAWPQVRGPGDHGVPLGHGIGFGLPAILRVSLRRRNREVGGSPAVGIRCPSTRPAT